MSNQMSKIHVWLGYTTQSESEFYNYFSVNPTDQEAGVGASQFDKEIGTGWYDDDFIGTYYAGPTPNLEACLAGLPTSAATTAQIRQAYLTHGLPPANALFYYTDAELTVPEPTRLFNGLVYLGVFDYD